jgi:hypothetical protein
MAKDSHTRNKQSMWNASQAFLRDNREDILEMAAGKQEVELSTVCIGLTSALIVKDEEVAARLSQNSHATAALAALGPEHLYLPEEVPVGLAARWLGILALATRQDPKALPWVTAAIYRNRSAALKWTPEALEFGLCFHELTEHLGEEDSFRQLLVDALRMSGMASLKEMLEAALEAGMAEQAEQAANDVPPEDWN